jgi:hypothetical protein
LDAVCHLRGKSVLRLATLARLLTLHRCIDPAATSKTPDWFRGTALPWLLRLKASVGNPSRSLRA